MDELSPLGTTEVLEVADGKVTRRTFDPVEELGWERFEASGLEGGERDDNARKVLGVLKGDVGGSARAATVLNAGAAIWVAGQAKTLADGVKKAEAALDAGAGLEKLRALREASQAG